MWFDRENAPGVDLLERLQGEYHYDLCSTDQLDSAFERLNALTEMPNLGLTYGDLKAHPSWDPLRKDPRLEKLLAKLAPRD